MIAVTNVPVKPAVKSHEGYDNGDRLTRRGPQPHPEVSVDVRTPAMRTSFARSSEFVVAFVAVTTAAALSQGVREERRETFDGHVKVRCTDRPVRQTQAAFTTAAERGTRDRDDMRLFEEAYRQGL